MVEHTQIEPATLSALQLLTETKKSFISHDRPILGARLFEFHILWKTCVGMKMFSFLICLERQKVAKESYEGPNGKHTYVEGCWGFPYLKICGFRGLSRFHHRKLPSFWETTWEKTIVLDQEIKNIQKYSIVFQKDVWFSRACLCFKMFRFPNFLMFQDFQISKIYQATTIVKLRCFLNLLWEANIFWVTRILKKNKLSQQSTLTFAYLHWKLQTGCLLLAHT